MSEKRPGSKVFLVVVMAIPVITSIVVACATGATSPAPAPTETSNTETEPMEPAPTLTVAPADTPQPSSTATPTNAPPTDTPAPQPTPTAEEGSLMANAQHGQELFNSLGCAACHGAQGEGGIGPTIAGTELSLARIVRQYRAPYQSMPRFGPDQVSESDIADIYAFLQTLPTPETRVPSVLANVTPEAGIGTIRGIIRYTESGEPAPDEQVFVVPASLNADGSLEFSYLPHLPAGTTDTEGQFEIADVEAQLYAVFYSRQEEPVLDKNGDVALANVLPGEATEVEGFIPAP